jgi:hypothetical protein
MFILRKMSRREGRRLRSEHGAQRGAAAGLLQWEFYTNSAANAAAFFAWGIDRGIAMG